MSASGMKEGLEVVKSKERQDGNQTMHVFVIF
jgi:hypothetical protein